MSPRIRTWTFRERPSAGEPGYCGPVVLGRAKWDVMPAHDAVSDNPSPDPECCRRRSVPEGSKNAACRVLECVTGGTPNAYAERFVRTIRSECLDHLLIVNARHLERILHSYARHYNGHRPHQGLSQEIPAPTLPSFVSAATSVQPSHFDRLHVRRRDRLGGLIHEYELAA